MASAEKNNAAAPLPATDPAPSRSPARARPIGRLTIAFTIMLGVLCGVGAFTFGYGKGASYLSGDPQACINCHVMQDHFDAWQHSSHHRVAGCNDCHLPHHPIKKWIVEGDNGFNHSLAFTLQNFHDPIQIKPRNRRVTHAACLHCHERMVHDMLPEDPDGEAPACIHCHADVGHALK